MMAGMNCGTLSMIAWPEMRDRLRLVRHDRATTYAADAMRRLADAGLVVGETGAAAVGALLAIGADEAGLDRGGCSAPTRRSLCICTEGATDPVNYEAVVGRRPADVGR